MLGNFSFGDYFKAEAIEWAWELVTGLGCDVSGWRLGLRARTTRRSRSGARGRRAARGSADPLGEKDNFWAMGDTGPCGPCSARSTSTSARRPPCNERLAPEADSCDRYIEIWNLVFMQYDREPTAR
jgi:alanyl-tRNA synthetase